ncbi:helix-turn-helix domain-containing protein [Nocardia miyunensis]|uniref:helix-turn-helix domain-containing protein n=1 Tax=Nocardia miyunensis TaxID=282684 RepID=UPI0008322E17|nr:helix-turn-helix transcriptional regulator [Nocardia miyunensis]
MSESRPNDVGRRLREIRAWRGLSLEAAAGLSGISYGYLGKLERGDKYVDSRRLLEALASALRVAPQEITGQPFAPADPLSGEAHAAIAGVETALETYDLGEDPGGAVRPWPELAAEVSNLNMALRENADYAAMGYVLPGLLSELHACYVRESRRRHDALVALIHVYRAAASVCKNLGVRGLPMMAVRQAHDCAQVLDEPEWLGYAAYLRGIMGGPGARQRQYELAVRAADQLAGVPGPNAVQVAGTLHFIAALACAVQRDVPRTHDHIAAAGELAQRLPERHENFAGLYFGPDNVGLWRVSLATELGDGAKVAELANDVRAAAIPLLSWQATFHADLGRALATDRETRGRSVESLVTAEQLAPQYVRNNPLVRETVTGLLPTAAHDHTGRELRGLAHRMGLAPR